MYALMLSDQMRFHMTMMARQMISTNQPRIGLDLLLIFINHVYESVDIGIINVLVYMGRLLEAAEHASLAGIAKMRRRRCGRVWGCGME